MLETSQGSFCPSTKRWKKSQQTKSSGHGRDWFLYKVELSHRGNSSTPQRIDLMERYLRVFAASSIEALLADREFVGVDWMAYLIENNVPFVIRLRENMRIETEGGRVFQLRSLLRKRCKGQWKGWLPGMARTPENLLRFEGKAIKGGELLLVATNIPAPKSALRLYRKRWGIECLFADAKTRGFNIEDTHITDPAKLATLLAVVALAMTWAYRCASQAMGRKGVRKKAHKRRSKSWFRTGFDILRRWILHDQEKALEAWRRTCPKRALSGPEMEGFMP
ncbi:transposase [Nitratireductor sp. XY-223]|uniref:transposase n=1 Tax=Nitratireductor sp. XY-223 TaxID=2561926 RepID=UPI0010AA3CA6|nr:transposase [Nitratireductor sp. XY-223]